MKTKLTLLTAFVVATQLTPILADDQKDLNKDRTRNYPADVKDRDRDRTAVDPQFEPFGVVTKAKGVIGMEVQNNQNEKLGKIDDIAMSFSSGRVVAVMVSVGGLLGVGDTIVAVPPSEFHHDANSKVVHLNRTKDELKNAPKLDVAQWDEFQKPERLAEVYRYYGVKPYFHDETVRTDVNRTEVKRTEVTRTEPNYRNRTDTTPSAIQQGNNESDLNTTARIRKDLLKRKDLSTSAHNVTVITRNGQVTIRGTVDSEDEKRIVAEIAKNAATPSAVDNQLEVSSTTNK